MPTKIVSRTIQDLFDAQGSCDNYSIHVFGEDWSLLKIEHIKQNVYKVYLDKGEEKREVPVSGEHILLEEVVTKKKNLAPAASVPKTGGKGKGSNPKVKPEPEPEVDDFGANFDLPNPKGSKQ